MSAAKSPREPRISESEWTVMKCFWSHGAMGMGEVVKALDGVLHWKPRTVQTLIRRLVEKGALRVESLGRDFRYHPAVSQEDCQRDESRSFLLRVFDGRLAPFVAAMVDRQEVSRDELQALRQLLDEAESRPAKSSPTRKRP
jgi:BlaI family penicillinase repressor